MKLITLAVLILLTAMPITTTAQATYQKQRQLPAPLLPSRKHRRRSRQ